MHPPRRFPGIPKSTRSPRGHRGATWLVTLTSLAAAVLAVPFAAPVTSAQAATPVSAAGQWHLNRGRIMDNVVVAPNSTTTVAVAGQGWLPSSNLDSVALNLSAEGETGSGSLSVYASDQSAPTATALSYGTANYQANLVISKVGADGRIKLVNSGTSAARVYLDNQGYTLLIDSSSGGSTYVPVSPTQILTDVTIAPNSTYRMSPLDNGPIPALGVQAVSLSISALSSGTGTVRVYGAGDFTPADATLDYAANTLDQNFAIAKIGTNTLLDGNGNGIVNINNFGSSPVTISVSATGYFSTLATTGALVHPLAPARIAENVSIEAGSSYVLPVLGRGGIPTSKPDAVGINLTARSTDSGVVTVSSSGLVDAGFNTVAYQPNSAVSTFSTARVGCSGQIVLTNTGTSAVTVSVDAYAYFGNPDNTAVAAAGTTAGRIEAVTGVADLSRRTTSDTNNVSVSSCTDDVGTNTISIPRNSASGVSATAAFGTVTIGVPASGTGTTTAGTTVYSGTRPGYSAAVQATDDGGFRALVHIDNVSAPTAYDFPVTLPAGTRLSLDDDGSVGIVKERTDSDGNSYTVQVAQIDKPWAKDAAGVSWPASFRLNGNTVTLTTDLTPVTNASGLTVSPTFPVVADPKYSWGWITGTIYYNRAETNKWRYSGTAITLAWTALAAITAEFGPVGWALGAGGVVAWSYYVTGVARTAYGDGECLKIKSYLAAGHYRGGYCR
ncbi:hypothetical protein KNE206_74420 [Kitasatospora sp. NE20-6]|uniref:hypothetical protein n=1 Tax=Kitasatospora sp. NE20-6 TaxID=2859066 RepID=UPI0034DC93C2